MDTASGTEEELGFVGLEEEAPQTAGDEETSNLAALYLVARSRRRMTIA